MNDKLHQMNIAYVA